MRRACYRENWTTGIKKPVPALKEMETGPSGMRLLVATRRGWSALTPDLDHPSRVGLESVACNWDERRGSAKTCEDRRPLLGCLHTVPQIKPSSGVFGPNTSWRRSGWRCGL